MPSIVITLIDPDVEFSLPARWNSDYQIDAIADVYLNGRKGFLLDLSPLQDPNINTFVQGCRPIELSVRTDYPYYYLLCAASPIPPAIGSAWEEYYRVSECRKVLRKTYTDFESGCREHWHWRLTYLIQKIYQTIKAWMRYGKFIWVSQKSDPPFYVLNSKQLTFNQQQTLLKFMRDKYWGGVIPKYVDATDPLAHSIKILASEVSQIKTE